MLILDISICVIVLLVGFNLKYLFSDFSKRDQKILTQLFFYHFLFATIFNFYIDIYGGDAQFYWSRPKILSIGEIIDLVKQGSVSGIMFLINYFPSKILNLSFFTGNILYALLGYLGFIYFYRIIKIYANNLSIISNCKILGISIFPWIWFLPNLHFWSSGIGKDTILFFCIALFVYSLTNLRRHLLGFIFSIIISLSLRPHITLFLLFAYGIGIVIDSHLKGHLKFILLILIFSGFLSIFGYVQDFLQLDTIEINAINEYTSKSASSLNELASSSGVDISEYPFPFKIATFLYRPLFFDINSLMAVVASFDNLILLIFTFRVLKSRPIKIFKKRNYLIIGSLIYFIIGTIAFSLILGNFGIILREKNMIIPLFLISGYWILYNYEIDKNNLK